MNIDEAYKLLGELRGSTQEALNGDGIVNGDDERVKVAKYSQALGMAINALAGHVPETSIDVLPALADEARAERLWDDDRRLFVRNLGWLLSQTRCGVVACELYGDQDREYVIARYDHGGKREIDVTADSYLAIIKDVTKRV